MRKSLLIVLMAVAFMATAFAVDATPTEIVGTEFTEITAVDVKATSTTFEVSYTIPGKIGMLFDIDIGSATDTTITFLAGDFVGDIEDMELGPYTADKKLWLGPLETFKFVTYDMTIKFTVTSSTIQTSINLYVFKLKE